MVNTSIRLGVALATLFNVAVVTATENPLSLDTTGGTANDTGFLGMLEEENDFDHGRSIAERKNCAASRQCTNAGGTCINSKAVCDGKEDPTGCKGRKCKCCIPDQNMSTCPSCPTTLECPTTPSCPTIPECSTTPSCPTIPECPTTLSCPTIPECPTTPSCPTTQECSTTPSCPTIPECPTISTSTCTPCTTQDTTTNAGSLPPDFEHFNNRVIRRTKRSDSCRNYGFGSRANWNNCMAFCNKLGAKPFIPRETADFQLYEDVRKAIGYYMWLPVNDRRTEGRLRWYNEEMVTDISPFGWLDGKVLNWNSADRDCVYYGGSISGGAVDIHMWPCYTEAFPPICEII